MVYNFCLPSSNTLNFSPAIDLGAAVGVPWGTSLLSCLALQGKSLPVCQIITKRQRKRGQYCKVGMSIHPLLWVETLFPQVRQAFQDLRTHRDLVGSSHTSPLWVTESHSLPISALTFVFLWLYFNYISISFLLSLKTVLYNVLHSPSNVWPFFFSSIVIVYQCPCFNNGYLLRLRLKLSL